MRRSRILAGALACLCACVLAQAEVRTFTDTQGRTLQATLLEATATNVRIQRDDGRIFEIERSTLSADDNAYVTDWLWKRAFVFGGVEISPRRVRLETDRIETKSRLIKTETWCYKIIVKNGSRIRLDGLAVEFEVFHVDDTLREDKRKRPRKIQRGRLALGTLEPGASAEVQTPGLELEVTQLKAGYRFSESNKRRIEDSLEGIRVRVLHRGSVLAELASPSSLATDDG